MFIKSDIVQIENLIKFFNKATIELQGVEILAAAESFKFLTRLEKMIKEEVKEQEIKPIEKKPETPKSNSRLNSENKQELDIDFSK